MWLPYVSARPCNIHWPGPILYFLFWPFSKTFFTNGPLGKHFPYLDPSTGRQDVWCHKCILGHHSQWCPILSSCNGVMPHRTKRAPHSPAPLGHSRAPMRLAPCRLIPVRSSLSSSSCTLSILLISLSQRAPPPVIRPSIHSCVIYSPSRSSPRYPPPPLFRNCAAILPRI
jgi:hypothetical protein